MLIGIDWGGTKIEDVAMTPEGCELLRLHFDRPRHDYPGCIASVVDMIAALEGQAGQTGSIGIGIPGSLEPVSLLGKGASSTWLLGQPVEADLQKAINRPIRVENDADCFAASKATDGAGHGHNVVFAVNLDSGAGAGIAVAGRAHHGPNNSGGEWGHKQPPALPRHHRNPRCGLLLRPPRLHGNLGPGPRDRGAVHRSHRPNPEGGPNHRPETRRRPPRRPPLEPLHRPRRARPRHRRQLS